MSRRLTLALAFVLSLAGTASAAQYPPSAPLVDKLYLLGADTNYLYWSADPTDPELGDGSIIRTCGVSAVAYGLPGRRPCLMGLNVAQAQRTYNIYFQPATVLDEPITWNANAPLRFHLVLDVSTNGVPFTLQFTLQKGTSLVVSPDATQVSPGIWEGQITAGAPLDPSVVNFLGFRITTQAPNASLELRGGGRSWLQLPTPVRAWSVPELGRKDSYHPEPTSYTSPTRTFGFNDPDWSVRSFTGTTAGATKKFDFTLERDAEALIAWVELFDSPWLRDVQMGRGLDPKKVQQGASVALTRDAELLDHSGGGSGARGIGTEALAIEEVPAGPLSVEVKPFLSDADNDMPFTVYVLASHGERTLRSMRWRFMQANSSRTPGLATCPGNAQPLPLTSEVRSVKVDLDWDSMAVGIPAWTFRYQLPGVGDFPCSEAGTGDRVRFTLPPTVRTMYIGATPAYDATFVAAWDTAFEVEAVYTYTAPPPEPTG